MLSFESHSIATVNKLIVSLLQVKFEGGAIICSERQVIAVAKLLYKEGQFVNAG